MMTLRTLALRSARHYWRTNLAVVAGVACAVAVLAGALLVGDSVRASLRDLAVGRLGQTDLVIGAAGSNGFFRQSLAGELGGPSRVAAPLIVAHGAVAHESTGARAAGVAVYGVDDRFFAFHGVDQAAPGRNDAYVSPAIAAEIGASEGATVLLRTRKPSDIPAEFLHGRRDDVGRTIRLRAAATLPREALGEFSLRPAQGATKAIFVRLDRLQRDLERSGLVNTVLVRDASEDAQASLEREIRARATLEDVGVRVRPLANRPDIAVESPAGLLDETVARAAQDAAGELGWRAWPLFTYLANVIRVGDRQVPYSLVTAMDLTGLGGAGLSGGREPERTAELEPPIILNTWAARELGAKVGDPATLEYYLWDASGRLVTKTTGFRVAGVVPVDAADRDFAPQYPGITEANSLADWDPPFPLDLSRVRPADDKYWDEYRTTPKAFVPIDAGQELWRSRYGQLTSVRVMPAIVATERSDAGSLSESARRAPASGGRPWGWGPTANQEKIDMAAVQIFAQRLRAKIDPLLSGLTVVAARREALAASAGATDFGEYFSYFSFFLVLSALLLGVLFFRLGVEQRLREIGALRAFGFTISRIRRLFAMEAAVLAVAGGLLGIAGAIAYAWVIMYGLRTWWVGAVGTTALELHAEPRSLGIGAAAGVLLAIGVVWWTLRALRRASPRALLAGDVGAAFRAGRAPRPRRNAAFASALALAAGGFAGAAAAGLMADAAGFFLAGALLLGSAVTAVDARLAAAAPRAAPRPGAGGVARLGLRYAAWRRGRSVLAVALIAAAVFLIVSVEAFRKDVDAGAGDRRSGTGGFALVAESALPVFHDPSTPEGRDALNLQDDQAASAGARYTIHRLRLRPGDDASCLNLYRPQRPRVVGVPPAFVEEGRFTFSPSLASTAEERRNPWRLLDRREPDAAIPALVDATSLQYVLHAALGDTIAFDEGGRRVAFRVVGTLADSLLQGEIIVSEARFVEAFPEEEGYRFFLVDVDGDRAAADRVAAFLEERLSDAGLDATSAPARLASFHRVENTYLSTFQALGGLGLLLGTVGLAAIAVRNVLERRRELALLRAIGYAPRDVRIMILAENGLLLALGLAAGVASALVAIAPALAERGGSARAGSLALLVAAVVMAGLVSSFFAARSAVRGPLVSALRSE